MAASRAGAHDLSYWRERILRALLLSTCLFAAVAYIPSVWMAIKAGVWRVVIADTAFYVFVLALALWPGVSYRVRAWGISSLVFGLGIVLIVSIGVGTSGLMWMGCAPVVAALTLGLRPAIGALVVNAVAQAAMAWAIYRGQFIFAPAPIAADGGLALFVIGSANTTLLSTALAWAVGSLLRGLEESHSLLKREIADRAQALADRDRLELQLREAQKLEAVGRLASGIAHDFNNLLVPILGNAEDLRRAFMPGTREATALDDIVMSAERGRSLVHRVLMFSRRAATPRTQVRLASVIRDAGQLLRAGLPASIDILYDITDADCVVMADPVDLHQVVMNLGTNAGYALRPAGGRLTLSLAPDASGDFVVMRVADTGPGMTAEVRDRAFEPFFTTKPTGEGSGLGLATVHAAVAALDGRVSIDTAPGKGTVVSVTLPRYKGEMVEAAPAAESAGQPAVPPAAHRYRVLVVDDEPLVLKVSAAVLRRVGYDVKAIGDAKEAANYVVTHAADIDLLLTDKTMPAFNGLELASIARTANPTLPIVLATGFLDDAARVEAEAVGVTRVIAKPYHAVDLAEAVRAALAARAAAS